jgi:hypothetical protein
MLAEVLGSHGAGRAFVNLHRFSSASLRLYTLQSLAPKGGQVNKSRPIRPPEGAKVEIANEDDDGYGVVTPRGKTWWVNGERVRAYRMTEIQIRTSSEGALPRLALLTLRMSANRGITGSRRRAVKMTHLTRTGH